MQKRLHQGFTLIELSIVLVIIGLIVGLLVIGGERYALPHTPAHIQVADGLSLDNLNKWTPICIDYPGQGTRCHVVLSFAFLAAPGDERYAILGLSENSVSLTAPMEKFTVPSWRVDAHPFEEGVSVKGDGAMLSRRESARLIEQMLTGRHLALRFVVPDTGRVIERSLLLEGFAQAYARYEKIQCEANRERIDRVHCTDRTPGPGRIN